jgi:hypothetical protein
MDSHAASRLDFHLAHPDISTDSYLTEQHHQWGAKVMTKRRIYLDTRFWIFLRETSLGRKDDRTLVDLLSLLRNLTNHGEAICPISDTTFLEVLRHQDLSTRMATAELVDELSGGACLRPRFDRLGLEMHYWTHSYLGYVSRYPLEHSVWTKLSFVFGVYSPHETGFDSATERACQKAFFDYGWTMSLTDVVKVLSEAEVPWSELDEKREFDRVAKGLNESNVEHAHEWKSFPELYRIEMLGLIEELVPVAVDILRAMRPDATRKHQQILVESGNNPEARFLSILKEEIRGKELRQTLRTSHVGAMCHASVRQNKGENLTGNDLHDFSHAEAAVAYCDAFLTERPLAARLARRNLELTHDFPCMILSTASDALKELKKPR